MTGKVKAAEGDAPALAYIASLPGAQRLIAERIDALAEATMLGLKRAVKWSMAYYGVEDGWCFSCGTRDDKVMLMFIRGTDLVPVPPVTPVAMGKTTRGIEIETIDDLDEDSLTSWMRQSLAAPYPSASKRKS